MHNGPRHRGFTLTEVLIVVASILFVAAIIIPKVTHSQLASRESAALASLNEIRLGEQRYLSSHPDAGFAPSLAALGSASDGSGNALIPPDVASGHKSGYTYTYVAGEKGNGVIRTYTVTAVPDEVGKTGQRRFFSDESGKVRYSFGGPADANSATLE
jgi:type IV pilus assembly protein PilA